MQRYGTYVLFALAILLAPHVCCAATHLDWTPYDPDRDYQYSDQKITIEQGGSYEVPEGADGIGRVWIDNPGSMLDPYARGTGEIYYVPDPADKTSREYVGTAGEVQWSKEGMYEMDAYTRPVSSGPRNKILAWLIPDAHAASGEFVDTIRFTITHGPPLSLPCCSSVAFIPGLQGSVLKNGNDTLWPPTVWSNDVAELALTESGESINPIVVDGVLDDFYGTPIYSGFINYMDSLVADESTHIAEWKALPYDWRLSPQKILVDGVETPHGTEYLVDEIENLASNSNTGHVSIVAHSMGGLMGKAIIRELMNRGEEYLVDTFIMVGTPQVGTAQGAAAILHGHDQAIPGADFLLPGLIVNPAVAREVAQNMTSAYNLMPSERYFSTGLPPPIAFDINAAFTQAWRDAWGPAIDNYGEFSEFITGKGVPRTNPSTDLSIPKVLNANRVQDAADFHQAFDTFDFPTSIRVVQIAGWGLPTPKSFFYKLEHNEPNYEVQFTLEGDATVVYPSAVSLESQEKYFFNIFDYNKNSEAFIQHRDLLSAAPVHTLVRDLLTGADVRDIGNITNERPRPTSISEQLLISTHSPVVIAVQDRLGRTTGTDSSGVNTDFLAINEEIPGSSFLSIGGDQYLFLPKSGSYSVSFKGTGSGYATIQTTAIKDDTFTTAATYTDMQVTSDATGDFELNANSPESAVISLDSDGDGLVDEIVAADNSALSLKDLLDTLRAKLESLDIKAKLKANLLKKVDKIEKKISKQKKIKASSVLKKLSMSVLKKGSKAKLTEDDVNNISALLDQIEQQIYF